MFDLPVHELGQLLLTLRVALEGYDDGIRQREKEGGKKTEFDLGFVVSLGLAISELEHILNSTEAETIRFGKLWNLRDGLEFNPRYYATKIRPQLRNETGKLGEEFWMGRLAADGFILAQLNHTLAPMRRRMTALLITAIGLIIVLALLALKALFAR